MSNVRVQIRFRNDLLQRLMDELPIPMYKFAEETGISYMWIMKVKALTGSPYTSRQDEKIFSKNAEKISTYFRVPPEVLFPEDIYKIKWPSLLEKQFPVERISALMQSEDQRRRALMPHESAEENERNKLIISMLGTLTPREERVIRMRFGFDDDTPHPYEEIGQDFEVSRNRIMQIANKALRKLRHKSRLGVLNPNIPMQVKKKRAAEFRRKCEANARASERTIKEQKRKDLEWEEATSHGKNPWRG